MAYWNSFDTGEYTGMIAETITIEGHDGKNIRAYFSRPMGDGPFPGIVLIPHMPGWDEYCFETARRFTQHGYSVLCPNIYEDYGYGTPPEVSARVRAQGGVHDDKVMEDTQGALNFLHNRPDANDRVGVIGMCSGGRHTFLAACTLEGVDAAVDCWGGGVVCGPEGINEARPVQAAEYADRLSCPLLGVFGNDDHGPTKEDVDKLESILKDCGKDFEFYRYDDAGHGFWYYDKPMYRQQQAMESLEVVLEFFERQLMK